MESGESDGSGKDCSVVQSPKAVTAYFSSDKCCGLAFQISAADYFTDVYRGRNV